MKWARDTAPWLADIASSLIITQQMNCNNPELQQGSKSSLVNLLGQEQPQSSQSWNSNSSDKQGVWSWRFGMGFFPSHVAVRCRLQSGSVLLNTLLSPLLLHPPTVRLSAFRQSVSILLHFSMTRVPQVIQWLISVEFGSAASLLLPRLARGLLKHQRLTRTSFGEYLG